MNIQTLELLSFLFGWLYFACWSISFYPQAISNYQRRSVTGLSVDFVISSFYGFLCYAIYTSSLYYSTLVQDEYQYRNNGNDNLVPINDVFFAVHATIMTFIFCVQVMLYRKSNEGPSAIGMALAVSLTLIIVIGALLVYYHHIMMFDYIEALSRIKVFLTIIKYISQVWLNWLRKCTTGWSITNVLFDFCGGLFSIAQLFLDAFTSGHMAGVFSYLPKLALGVISIIFDTIFILQHYVWFPSTEGPHLSTYERFDPPPPPSKGNEEKPPSATKQPI